MGTRRNLEDRFRQQHARGICCWRGSVILDQGGLTYYRIRPEDVSLYAASMPDELLSEAKAAAVAVLSRDGSPIAWESKCWLRFQHAKGEKSRALTAVGHGQTPEAAVIASAEAMLARCKRDEASAADYLTRRTADRKRIEALLTEAKRAADDLSEYAETAPQLT